MLGILLIHKTPDLSSHDVVNRVRRLFGVRRVGHAGTLDPLASGLIVVAVGPATRFLQFLPLEPKEYVFETHFGIETETYDREGAIVSEQPVPDDLEARVRAALPNFLGLVRQMPPMYSAIKLKGKPLYAYAREGKEVPREARTVHLGEIEILEVRPPLVKARLVCSGGTYVRSLARDLGEAVGCGAHMASLVRTRVGRFELGEAKLLEALSPEDLIPLREALPPMPLLEMDTFQEARLRQGQRLVLPPEQIPLGAERVGLTGEDGEVFGVARVVPDGLQPECVIPGQVVHEAL